MYMPIINKVRAILKIPMFSLAGTKVSFSLFFTCVPPVFLWCILIYDAVSAYRAVLVVYVIQLPGYSRAGFY